MADTYWDHPSRREIKRLIDLGDAGAILDDLQNRETEWDDAREALDHLVRGPRAEVERLRAELATVRDKKALARALSELQGFAQRETARADNAEAERDAARNELAAAHDELMRTRLMLSDARDERDAALDGTEGGQ